MDVLEVSAQIAALSEGLVTELAFEWALTSMFSKVVSEVAGLLEFAAAVVVHALEVQLDAPRVWVAHLDGLMPSCRNTLECFRYLFERLLRHSAIVLVRFEVI